MKRRFQFRFLTSHGLRPEHRLLDVGCGTLRGGIPLIEYLGDGNYVGFEARTNVLDEGRKELAEAGLEHKHPLLICESDPSRVEPGGPIDFMWAFSVLIHMSDEILDASLGLAARVLGEDGKFYGNVQLGERMDRKWSSFPWVWRPREFYESAAARHGLSVENLGALRELGHRTGSPEQDQGSMLCFARGPQVSDSSSPSF
jgi:cyclopropane fatty-acyl-phospholipid synthase-like methyltransferase